jgi:hypothetical protein
LCPLALFAQIESFLDGAETPKKTPLPWLFCDSTFLKFKDPTYQAQDKDCIGMIDPDQTPIVIGNEYKTQLTGGKRPFWSEDMCTYVFELPGQGDTYCAAVASQGGLAVTIDTVHNELVKPEDTRTAIPSARWPLRTHVLRTPFEACPSKPEQSCRRFSPKA